MRLEFDSVEVCSKATNDRAKRRPKRFARRQPEGELGVGDLKFLLVYDIDAKVPENEVRLVRPGDLTWDPKFGELAFTYGTAECRLPTGPNALVVYGSIESVGLESFANFARRRRFEGVGELRITRS